MDQEHYLIVEKQGDLDEEVTPLLADSFSGYNLDTFSIRQRLTGKGLALFAKGKRPALEDPARRLGRHGIRWWLLAPTSPRFAPGTVRALASTDEGISFETHQGTVEWRRGETVLAVLADLSGKVVEKSLRRLLVQNAYRGAGHVTDMAEDEQYQAILRASPVLDLYRLAADGSADSALRAFAGKFNPSGLQQRATYSASGNLEGLLHLVQEYAGDFTLRTDFGLDRLPGCLLKTEGNAEELQRANLASLSRYGWLMADLWAEERRRREGPDPSLGVATLAAGAAGLLAEELGHAAKGKNPATPPPSDKARDGKVGLPLPPPRIDSGCFSWRKIWIGSGGAGLACLIPLFAYGGGWMLSTLQHGLRTGILPAIASIPLFWSGFHFLRLKRLVENTPTSKSRSVAMGMVEVQGRAIRQYALVSPISQLACVYYRVRKYVREENANWRLSSESDSGQVPFFLQDETGRVQIDPGGATVRPRTRTEGLPGRMGILLASSGMADANEKWVEEVITEGTFLYVLGFARSARPVAPSLRERTIDALRSLKSDTQRLKRYDADGDGHISPEEWEVARADVEMAVVRNSLAEKTQSSSPEERIVIGRPHTKGLPFVIAETESEAHLTRNYHLLTLPLLAAGGAMALWAAFAVFTLFGIR